MSKVSCSVQRVESKVLYCTITTTKKITVCSNPHSLHNNHPKYDDIHFMESLLLPYIIYTWDAWAWLMYFKKGSVLQDHNVLPNKATSIPHSLTCGQRCTVDPKIPRHFYQEGNFSPWFPINQSAVTTHYQPFNRGILLRISSIQTLWGSTCQKRSVNLVINYACFVLG